jgi:phosphate transport system protein
VTVSDPPAVTDEHVLQMFALVADAIRDATTAFLSCDTELARRVVAEDRHLDALEAEVAGQIVAELTSGRAIAPEESAWLVATLRIVPELERTGDLAEHIALRTPQRLATHLPPRCRSVMAEMARVAAEMWVVAADAYARKDGSAADALRLRDDSLDDLHVSLTAGLAAESLSVPVAIELGLVARFLERLGDHAVNVTRHLPTAGRPAPKVFDG